MALRIISRGSLRAWTIGHLKVVQDGKCAVCGRPIALQTMGKGSEYVADHDHDTGEIRGVLCRPCNSGEGKVSNAAGSWGARSMDYVSIIAWLKQLITYLESPGTGIQYPGHKSAVEVAEAARLKRNKAAVQARVAAKMKAKAPEK